MRCGLVVGLMLGCSSPAPIHLPPAAPITPAIASPSQPCRPHVVTEVPDAPAFRLPHTFEPTSYRARLALEDRTFAGNIEITGELSQASSVIWLHGAELHITCATAIRDGISVPLEYTEPRRDELLGLSSATPLAAGRWTVELAYTGVIHEVEPPVASPNGPHQPHTHGVFVRRAGRDAYVFTQSEPSDARRIFPCFDEPDRKVPWQLTLDVRAGVTALGNAPVVHESALDNDHKRVELAPTLPLPSYLIAFAVGPFDIVDAGTTKSGAPIRIVSARGGDATWAKTATPRIVNLLEDWIGVPYAYPKLDLVAVPKLGLGAMEHPGLITVDDELAPFAGKDEAARGTFTFVAAHELAHQWFGNLVTPRWWDDIWLSENFAAWMSAKVSSSVDLLAPNAALQSAPILARLESTAPVRKPVTNQGGVERTMTEIDYDTGADVLRLFEVYVGPEQFRSAVQKYLAKHAHGSATTSDFLAEIDAVAGHDVSALLASFIDGKHVPEIHMRLACERGRGYLDLTSVSMGAWSHVPVCVAYERDGSRAETCVSLDAQTMRVPLAGRACGRWVFPKGLALYRPRLIDAKQNLDALVDHGWPLLSKEERRAIYDQLDERSLRMKVVPKLLDSNDPETIDVGAAMLAESWSFVPETLRPKLAAWVVKKLAVRAKTLRLADMKPPLLVGLPVIELVALAGEHSHAREAIDLAAKFRELPDGARRVALRIAANEDRGVATRLLANTKGLKLWSRSEVLNAVAYAEHVIDVIRATPDLADLDLRERTELLAARCDVARLAELEKLADEIGADRRLVNWLLVRCDKEQKALEPAFTSLLAK